MTKRKTDDYGGKVHYRGGGQYPVCGAAGGRTTQYHKKVTCKNCKKWVKRHGR